MSEFHFTEEMYLPMASSSREDTDDTNRVKVHDGLDLNGSSDSAPPQEKRAAVVKEFAGEVTLPDISGIPDIVIRGPVVATIAITVTEGGINACRTAVVDELRKKLLNNDNASTTSDRTRPAPDSHQPGPTPPPPLPPPPPPLPQPKPEADATATTLSLTSELTDAGPIATPEWLVVTSTGPAEPPSTRDCDAEAEGKKKKTKKTNDVDDQPLGESAVGGEEGDNVSEEDAPDAIAKSLSRRNTSSEERAPRFGKKRRSYPSWHSSSCDEGDNDDFLIKRKGSGNSKGGGPKCVPQSQREVCSDDLASTSEEEEDEKEEEEGGGGGPKAAKRKRGGGGRSTSAQRGSRTTKKTKGRTGSSKGNDEDDNCSAKKKRKRRKKKGTSDQTAAIMRSLQTQVDIITVPELVSAFTAMKRTTQEMVDSTYIAKLLPECSESYLVEQYQMPPPSDSVVLAFTAVGVGYLIQDNNSSIRNSYPTNVYVALHSALNRKFGSKRRTRTMLRQKITTWVTENFTSDMFATGSGNMVVAYEKSESNYFMAVKPRYHDDSYTYVVSSKMDIGYAIGKLILVPFFRNQDVKDVLFGCFDRDILPHIENLLPDMVDFLIRTKVGAEEIYTIFAKIFASCSWNERNTAFSTPPFTLPDFFDKTESGDYYYAKLCQDDNLHILAIGDALRKPPPGKTAKDAVHAALPFPASASAASARTVGSSVQDASSLTSHAQERGTVVSFGLLPALNGTMVCPSNVPFHDVDDQDSAHVYTTTLRIVMTIIEMAMRIPCRRPPKDSPRGDNSTDVGGDAGATGGTNHQHIPRVYILFWSDDPEDVIQLRNAILVLTRYHATVAGRGGRNNYINYLMKKSITYSNHNLPMPSPVKRPIGVHSQWFARSPATSSSASSSTSPHSIPSPSSPAPTAVDRRGGVMVDIPFLNANAPNPLHLAFAVCPFTPVPTWNGKLNATNSSNTIIVKCVETKYVTPTDLIDSIHNMPDEFRRPNNVLAFSSLLRSMNTVGDMSRVLNTLQYLLSVPDSTSSETNYTDDDREEDED